VNSVCELDGSRLRALPIMSGIMRGIGTRFCRSDPKLVCKLVMARNTVVVRGHGR
jgi:hypothetical protein